MELHVVLARQIVNVNVTVLISVELVVGQVNQSLSPGVQVSSEGVQELVVSDLAVIVSVEELENSLEFGGRQVVAVLLQTPHEFIAIQTARAVIVHTTEHDAQSSDSVCSSLLQSLLDLLQNLVGWFSGKSKDGVDVRVVSRSHVGKEF